VPASAQSPTGSKLCPQCRQIYPASIELCPRDAARLIVDQRIIVGKYILLNRLGGSPTSEVYAAEQPQLGRMVAVKLLPRDPEVERHFDSQVRSIGNVKHDHVVTLYDSGRIEDGRPYIAMEYLEGADLALQLSRTGAMTAERALLLWRQAVSGIAAAHRRNIVHGGINPTKLFLTHKDSEAGQEEIVKIVDFHIGKQTPHATPADASVPGASADRYIAPEQWQSGEVTPRADVYALGLVLLEMLSGRVSTERVLDGKEDLSPALLRQLAQSRAQEAGQRALSDELLRLIGDTLRRDPQERPADAGELGQLIKALPDGGLRPEQLARPAESSSMKLGAGSPPVAGEGSGVVLSPFEGSETPQMGVAVLTNLLKQIQDGPELTSTAPQPVPPVTAVKSVPPVPPGGQGRRTALRLAVAILFFAFLGGSLAWLTRSRLLGFIQNVISPPSASPAAPSDLGVAPAGVPADSLAADLAPGPGLADLGPSPTLAAPDGASAGLGGEDSAADAGTDVGDSGTIRVKFVYDPEAVTAIECNQDSLVAPRAGEKRGAGVEALLRPGGLCRATGPGGSKAYKYDTLAQRRPDSSGVRRIRVRLGEAEAATPPIAPPGPDPSVARPLPAPPSPTLDDRSAH